VISAQALIEKALPNLEPVVEAQNVRLITNIAPNLPDLTVDAAQIGHVFSNLISNAAKHSQRGQEIILSAKMNGQGIRFGILDQGPGIPREFQSRIFERFFRIPGAEESKGIGLGLAIAREIVVSHGGSIGVQSSPGQGSEFYFKLPPTNGGKK
jgi:signal transduction histidine kinase